jgi:thiamine-phosphate pyrophosphorylase
VQGEDLRRALRLVVITDRALAAPREVAQVVTAALAGGARAIQLRNKGDSARTLFEVGTELRAVTKQAGALLFVNDRVDVALAIEADGVHLGPDDPPVAAVRAIAPDSFLIGYSTDDPKVAREAIAAGADYIGCGAVYPTATKSDAGDVIGLRGLSEVAAAVTTPVVAIGGITVERASDVAEAGASGMAVVGAIMQAPDPGAVTGSLLRAFARR